MPSRRSGRKAPPSKKTEPATVEDVMIDDDLAQVLEGIVAADETVEEAPCAPPIAAPDESDAAPPPEPASLDDVTINEDEVFEGDAKRMSSSNESDLPEPPKRLSSPDESGHSSPEEIVVEQPESRRSSMAEWEGGPKAPIEELSEQAPAPSKLKSGFFNSGSKAKKESPKNSPKKDSPKKDDDKKAFLNSGDSDEDFDTYDTYKSTQRGSNTYYDSDYQERRYSDDDMNPWSCENILVGLQLICCLLVVIACVAAMVIPLFAHKLNPEMRLAVQAGDTDMVRMLLGNGTVTHVDATGSKDMTALHWASMRGQNEVAALLLESRANTEKASGTGLKPVHYAVKGGHSNVVGTLLEHRANSNATDNNGWTPLHWAGVWGRADIARMLLAADANPTVQCEERAHKTALSLAQSNGHSALIRILDKAMEEYVARVNASLANVTV